MSVISILGNTSPRIGTATKYVAITPYANILRNSMVTSQENILWDIYVLENGKWRKTQGNSKKGKEVEYTFTQRSLLRKGIKLVVNIDGKTGELLIKPMPALAPKILKVELLDGNYQKINRTIGYNDKIYAKAYCADLDGQKIDFYLWEDDVIGSGHHKDNEINKVKHVKSKSIVHKGIAIAEFNLFYYSSYATTIANIQNPKGQKSEGDTHEYYVTAEYNHKKTASGNVNMRKPLVNRQTENTYTQSIKNNVIKKDIQGKIINVSFVDKNKKPIYNLKYTDKIIAKIESTNLINKSITISIFEEDILKDDLVWQKQVMVQKDIFYQEISITQQMWQKANDGKDNTEQEYYIKIEYSNDTVISDTIYVQKNIPTTPLQKGKSKSKVGGNKNHNKNNTCPNCNKNITLEEIKKICVNAEGICSIENTSMIEKALPYLNQYRQKVGISTCLAKAHFLAQISQESKFFQLQEKFKYSSAERMRGIFLSYFRQFGSIENQKKEANRLSQLSLDSKNWQEVANAIYGKKHPNGAKHTEEDDGWRYSGKGFKQITWKDNYENLQKYTKDTLGVDVNWVGGNNPYKLKENPKDAIISALAFWGSKKLSNLATGTTDKDIENVTYIINEKGEGLKERIRYFRKAEKALKLNECTAISENKQENNDKGSVVVVSGKGSKKISKWVVYETYVYNNISLENYKKLKKEGKLPKPNFTTYLSRDAHGEAKKYGKHSSDRYGKNNETPPGEYFLIPSVPGQMYKIYLSSSGKSALINGIHGTREGVAIHQYSPQYAIGCLTTVSGRDTSPVDELISHIPLGKKGYKNYIILEERDVIEENWTNPTVGTKKWTGVLDKKEN